METCRRNIKPCRHWNKKKISSRAGKGPAWLREKEDAWPQTSPQLFQQKTDDMEQVFEVMSEEKNIEWEKFGSFRKMTRIFAYCLRFQSKRKVVMTEELQQVIRRYCGKARRKASVLLTRH